MTTYATTMYLTTAITSNHASPHKSMPIYAESSSSKLFGWYKPTCSNRTRSKISQVHSRLHLPPPPPSLALRAYNPLFHLLLHLTATQHTQHQCQWYLSVITIDCLCHDHPDRPRFVNSRKSPAYTCNLFTCTVLMGVFIGCVIHQSFSNRGGCEFVIL